ncbi:MAG: transposase [Pseudomonadota bacterium]|nr:transposase [Pseudomonadota bacterium]
MTESYVGVEYQLIEQGTYRMRKTTMLCIVQLLFMTGCTQSVDLQATSSSEWENTHDERDQIKGPTPLQARQLPNIGVKKIIVAAVEWPGEQKLNPALLQKQVFSLDPTSLRSYILAASKGKLDLAGEVITHVSDRPRPEVCNRTTYPFSLAVEEGTKAVIANGRDPKNYDFQFNIVDCGGMASAQVGGKQLSVYGQAIGTYIYWHEFGHSLGYTHGNSLIKCPSSGNVISAPTGCTTIAYGDTGNPVGGGSFLPDAKSRYFSGWLDDKQSVLITKTGLYRLGVLGKTEPQGYRIDRPGQTPPEMVMEYRKPGPYDIFQPGDNRANGVWIRYSTKTGALLTTQLDGTPETASTADPTFLPGKVLKDEAAGITVKVCSVSNTGATIAVSVNNQEMPGCVLQPPYAANPGSVRNPVRFSGLASPGAEIRFSCKYSGRETTFNTMASMAERGDWSVEAPYLAVGYNTCEIRQHAADITSEATVLGIRVTD